MTSGWPPRGPAPRSAGHCPYEAALPRVTCCPLPPRYLSPPDSPFLFLSEPLLFHLPVFTSPLLSLAPVLSSHRQHRLPRPRRAGPTPQHHPRPGQMTSSFRGLPNDGAGATGPQVRARSVCAALAGWTGSSLRSARGVITSQS